MTVIWEDTIDELEENHLDYVEIEKMGSRDSFKVMEDYANFVDNTVLKEKLINALNRPKPFTNFKWIVDNSSEYRQIWFDFKLQKYIEWVEDRIKAINIDEELNTE